MITIDVVHDVICPWCRVGEHHLDAALERWDGEPVNIRLHAFQLAPEIPPEGADYRAHLLKKFGDPRRLDAIHERLNAIAAPLGLTFRHDRIQRLPNTLRAHAMIAAVPQDKQRPLLHAMQRAYFEDGRDMGSTDVLSQLGESAGLTAEAARVAATSDLDGAREDAREMIELGVTGVPAFIIDRKYQIVGAQPPEVLLKALGRVASEHKAQNVA